MPLWQRIGLIVVLVGLAPFVALAAMSLFARRPANLGLHDGRLAACPESPNCVCSQCPADDAEHHIAPLEFTGDPQAAWRTLESVVRQQPRSVIVTAEDAYLYAEFTSRIFRFVDDVEFQLDADAGVIHCRSASRVGHSDMGANRERIERIRKDFQAAAAGVTDPPAAAPGG